MKKGPLIIRFLILKLVTIFTLTNVVWGYAPQTNFWDMRASLRGPSGPQQSNAADSVLRLPRRNDTIIHIPHNLGTIRHITKGNLDNIIIHIQDVHQNTDAQHNIGKSIEYLLENEQVDLIALEGAFDDFDLKRFRDYPNRQTIKSVSDYLLKNHTISGPVHSLLNTPEKIPPVVGIDDEVHYHLNLEAVKKSYPLRDKLKAQNLKLKINLNREKLNVFNKELLAFDNQIQAYRDNELPLNKYAVLLDNYSSPRPNVIPGLTRDPGRTFDSKKHVYNQDPGLRRGDEGSARGTAVEVKHQTNLFLEAQTLEQTLNFSQVEHERNIIIKNLAQKLSSQATKQLLTMSTAFKSGNLNHADFYAYLHKLCEKNNVSLKKFSAMRDYIQYVLLSDQIDAEKLNDELADLELQVYASLTKSDQEKSLIEKSRHQYLTTKLIDFSLTKNEWNEYGGATHAVGRGTASPLQPFENFYAQARIRDQKMAENISHAIKKHNSKLTILVTGGFHSEGIKNILTVPRTGYSGPGTQYPVPSTQYTGPTIISFIPKISKLETMQGSTYLSVFTQEKTPLQKLVEGPKLFLPTPPFPTHVSSVQFATMAALFEKLSTPFKVLASAPLWGINIKNATQNSHRGTLTNGSDTLDVQIEVQGDEINNYVESINSDWAKETAASVFQALRKIISIFIMTGTFPKPGEGKVLNVLSGKDPTMAEQTEVVNINLNGDGVGFIDDLERNLSEHGLSINVDQIKRNMVPAPSVNLFDFGNVQAIINQHPDIRTIYFKFTEEAALADLAKQNFPGPNTFISGELTPDQKARIFKTYKEAIQNVITAVENVVQHPIHIVVFNHPRPDFANHLTEEVIKEMGYSQAKSPFDHLKAYSPSVKPFISGIWLPRDINPHVFSKILILILSVIASIFVPGAGLLLATTLEEDDKDIPKHWNKNWEKPTPDQRQQAEGILYWMNSQAKDKTLELSGQVFATSEHSDLNRAQIMRALYYDHPDIAAIFFMSFAMGVHGEMAAILLDPKSKEFLIEPEMAGQIFNHGLTLVRTRVVPEFENVKYPPRAGFLEAPGIILNYMSPHQTNIFFGQIDDENLWFINDMVNYAEYISLQGSMNPIEFFKNHIPKDWIYKGWPLIENQNRDLLIDWNIVEDPQKINPLLSGLEKDPAPPLSSHGHWKEGWPTLNSKALAEAQSIINNVTTPSKESISERIYKITSEKHKNLGEMVDILLALFYLDPDLAGAILMDGHPHGVWSEIAKAIDPEIITAMANHGLDFFRTSDQKLSDGFFKILFYYTEDLAGGIIKNISDLNLPLLLQSALLHLKKVPSYGVALQTLIARLMSSVPLSKLQEIFGDDFQDLLVHLQKFGFELSANGMNLNFHNKRVTSPIGKVDGKAIGILQIVRELEPKHEFLAAIPDDRIVAVEYFPTSHMDIGPFRGVITHMDEGETGHALVRAQGSGSSFLWGIPYARTPGPESFEHLDGKWVVMEVNGEDFSIREATADEITNQQIISAAGGRPVATLPSAVLDSDPIVALPQDKRITLPQFVSQKVSAINRLRFNLDNFNSSDVNVEFIEGPTLLFSAFTKIMTEAGLYFNYRRLVNQLKKADGAQAAEILKTIRELIMKLDSGGAAKSVIDELFSALGPNFWARGIFVRNAANAQDLPQYLGLGAGIYLTVPHVKNKTDGWEAIKRVWASTWTDEAHAERSSWGIDPASVHTAIWLVPTIHSEYSFNIHSSRISNPDELVIEIMPGQGEGLMGENEKLRGRPTTIIWNKKSKRIIKLDQMTKEYKVVLKKSGESEINPVNPGDEFLNLAEHEKITDILIRVTESASAFFDKDVLLEGALTRAGPEKKWTATLLQSVLVDPTKKGKHPAQWNTKWDPPQPEDLDRAKKYIEILKSKKEINGRFNILDTQLGAGAKEKAKTLRAIGYINPTIAGAIILSFKRGHGNFKEVLLAGVEPDLVGKMMGATLPYVLNHTDLVIDNTEFKIKYEPVGISGLMSYLPSEYGFAITQELDDNMFVWLTNEVMNILRARKFMVLEGRERVRGMLAANRDRLLLLRALLNPNTENDLIQLGIFDTTPQPLKKPVSISVSAAAKFRAINTINAFKHLDVNMRNGNTFAEMHEAGVNLEERAQTFRALNHIGGNEIAAALLGSIGEGNHTKWTQMLFPNGKPAFDLNEIAGLFYISLWQKATNQIPLIKNNDPLEFKFDLRGMIGILLDIPIKLGSSLIQNIDDDFLYLLINELHGAIRNVPEHQITRHKISQLLLGIPLERIENLNTQPNPSALAYVQSHGIQRDPFHESPEHVEKPVVLITGGPRVGPIHIVTDEIMSEASLKRIPQNAIAAMIDLPTSDLKIRYGGLIIYSHHEAASHAMERSLDWGTPLAAMALSNLADFKTGDIVYFEVLSNQVILRHATSEEITEYENSKDVPREKKPTILPQVDLSGPENYLKPGHPKLSQIPIVGPKIAHLNYLASTQIDMPDLKLIDVQYGSGSAFTFYAFRRLLQLNGDEKKYDDLVAELNKTDDSGKIRDLSIRIQALILNLNLFHEKDPFWNKKNLVTTFKSLWENGVFVRDATNAQNLPQYPGMGAGLYLTVENVIGEENFWRAIKDVYADVWSENVIRDRKANQIDQTTVHPAVWFSPSRLVDYAIVMQTSDVFTDRLRRLVTYVVQGLGEAIVSQEARFRGQSSGFIWNKKQGRRVHTQKNKKEYRSILLPAGGTDAIGVNLSREFTELPEFSDLAEELSKVGMAIENHFKGSPQKIEATLYFDQAQEKWILTLDQVDPLSKRIVNNPSHPDEDGTGPSITTIMLFIAAGTLMYSFHSYFTMGLFVMAALLSNKLLLELSDPRSTVRRNAANTLKGFPALNILIPVINFIRSPNTSKSDIEHRLKGKTYIRAKAIENARLAGLYVLEHISLFPQTHKLIRKHLEKQAQLKNVSQIFQTHSEYPMGFDKKLSLIDTFHLIAAWRESLIFRSGYRERAHSTRWAARAVENIIQNVYGNNGGIPSQIKKLKDFISNIEDDLTLPEDFTPVDEGKNLKFSVQTILSDLQSTPLNLQISRSLEGHGIMVIVDDSTEHRLSDYLSPFKNKSNVVYVTHRPDLVAKLRQSLGQQSDIRLIPAAFVSTGHVDTLMLKELNTALALPASTDVIVPQNRILDDAGLSLESPLRNARFILVDTLSEMLNTVNLKFSEILQKGLTLQKLIEQQA